MTKEEHLQQHFELCKRVYQRLLAEGNWPWEDSLNSEDVVESEDQSNTA